MFLVPQVAVIQNDKGRMVMVTDAENKVTPRTVQTAEWLGKDWVISGGLQAGDKVIVDNLMKLRPGIVVAPQVAGAKPTPVANEKPAAADKLATGSKG